jgi:exonuclease 1
MGIQGLLPLLKPITKAHHISFYKNRRVAVDGYSWLHKAVYGCCIDMTNGKDNLQWVSYCIYLIDMLLSFDIRVHLVFDGANLPAKKMTEVTRAAKRAAALSTGLQLLASQNADKMAAARSYLSNAVDVTPSMAALLIKILRLTRPTVQCTVAPYEADAQLAYLCSARLVDAVISEDSDTIPYGCTEVMLILLAYLLLS